MTQDGEMAFDVGIQLSAAIREAPEIGKQDVLCEYIDRLVAARAETEADAYTLTIWAASLLRELSNMLPEPLMKEPAALQYAVSLTAAMCFRASAALEKTTGLDPDIFNVDKRARH